HDLANARLVVVLDAAPDCVRHQVLRDSPDNLFAPVQQHFPELGWSCELGGVDQHRRGIDWRMRVEGAPLTDRVEVLERESQRIHGRMAGCTHGILAMIRQPFADRMRLARGVFLRREARSEEHTSELQSLAYLV